MPAVRRVLAQALVIAVCGLIPGTAHASGPGPRWPLWPTEIDRVTAPLRGPDRADEGTRIKAVRTLEAYATPVIETALAAALEDPSPRVLSEVLKLCFARAASRCVAPAATLWSESTDDGVRTDALRVLALDAAPSRVAILLDALRDQDSAIRQKAAEYLGWASLPPEVRDEARDALLAKLADTVSDVRRHAAASLGLLGPGRGTLTLARLLEDPDPAVRADVATALGRIEDPRAAPALERALEVSAQAGVSRAVVSALAVLPDPKLDARLLDLFDDPPPGVTREQVADAIGRRRTPAPVLLDGLVDRLRLRNARDPAVLALLRFGVRARPALERALHRGIEPLAALEAQRLLDAIDLPDEPIADPDPLPPDGDRARWHAALSDPSASQRLLAAATLGRRAPTWLGDAVARALATPVGPRSMESWLLAAAQSVRPVLDDRRDAIAWRRITAVARERTGPDSLRCAATVALGAAAPTRHRRFALAALAGLAAEPSAVVRGCTAVALQRFGRRARPDLAALLTDHDASVRVQAALALGAAGPGQTMHRLAAMGVSDPSGEVRHAARFALARPEPDLGPPSVVWRPIAATAWQRSARLDVKADGHRLALPAIQGETALCVVAPLGALSGAEPDIIAAPH